MSDDDQFWLDDANPKPAADVLRMPAASVVVPPDLVGSHATASADWRTAKASPNHWPAVIGISAVCVASFFAFGALMPFVYTLLPAAVPRVHSQPVITAEEFGRCENGMTVQQCVETIGHPGSVTMDLNLGDGHRSQTIEWKNSEVDYAAMIFEDGRLKSKVSFGL